MADAMSGANPNAVNTGMNRSLKVSPQQGQSFVNQYVPPAFQQYIPNAQKFTKGVMQGGRLAKGIARQKAIGDALGYDQPQKDLTSYAQNALTAPGYGDPTLAAMQSYVSQRLGVGLTPQEMAAARGMMTEPIKGQAAQASRDVGSRLSSAGIDPRSGIGMAAQGQVERGTQQGLAEAGRQLTLEDLARKQQIEQEGLTTAGLEQRGQMAQEATLGDLSRLTQQQREYLTDFTESRRQAAMARDAWRRAAQAMQPSGLEKASGIVGGVLGGLGA